MTATEPGLHVVVVCLGNICRSPLIARLLADRLAGSATVESFGLIAMPGTPMDARAAVELERLGGSAEGFASRRLDGRAVARADLVLAATSDIRSRILAETPTALRRTFTLLELAHLLADAPAGAAAERIAWAAAHRSLARGVDVDLLDPIGGEQAVHRQVADLVDEATRVIGRELRR